MIMHMHLKNLPFTMGHLCKRLAFNQTLSMQETHRNKKKIFHLANITHRGLPWNSVGIFMELMQAHGEQQLCSICFSLLLTYICSQSGTKRFGVCDTMSFPKHLEKEIPQI